MMEFFAVFLVSYIWHAMGVTIGYHRLLSHRSFSCPKWVEYLLVLPGFLAFEGSPIWWATIHRAHHKHVDTKLDPHSPRNGLWQAQFGWLGEKVYPSHIVPAIQSKDLLKDPIYRFLEQDGNLPRGHAIGFAACFLFRVGIFFAFGWVPALASLLAGLAVVQIPLMLNVFCHLPKFGYKNYAVEDDSVNVWWVGILALGEGWHNNHHAAPGSARSGMRAFEFDPSWLMICLLQKIGLVSRVNAATHKQLLMKATARQLAALGQEVAGGTGNLKAALASSRRSLASKV